MQPTVKLKTTDNSGDLMAQLKALSKMQVLVGIPEDKAERKPAKGEAVNNAQLMFIHTNGSPLKGIPKRPVIEPAIEASGNKEPITEELGEAAHAILDSDPEAARQHLKRAGMTGQNAARAWFTDPRNHWQKNSKETIQRKGSDRPLIDTGELRRSIVYIVEEGE